MKIDLEPPTASIAFKGEPMTFPCSSGLNMCHQAASSLISWLCNVVACVLGCPNGACMAHACHWHPFYFPYSLWYMAVCMKMAAWGSVGWSLLKTNINSGPRRRQLQITGPTRSVQTWKCTSMPSDGHMMAHVIEIHCVINISLWNIQIRYALQPCIITKNGLRSQKIETVQMRLLQNRTGTCHPVPSTAAKPPPHSSGKHRCCPERFQSW